MGVAIYVLDTTYTKNKKIQILHSTYLRIVFHYQQIRKLLFQQHQF